MKEITRVHIAGVSYDIEIDAKKVLQTYLDSIKKYTDSEVLRDVEVRIVELLADAGVAKDKVITSENVTHIKEQLGQPEAFSENDGAIEVSAATSRKLYRDSGKAWVGGVAAGIAAYYGTKTWWIRILLLLTIPITSGLSMLLYVLAWLIIPATKSPSDVLRLHGKPVTVDGINTLSDESVIVNPTRDRNIVRIISKIIAVGIALFLLAALIVAVIGVIFGIHYGASLDRFGSYMSISSDIKTLFVISVGSAALLGFAALLLLSYLLFMWRFTKAIVVVTIVLSILALVASGISLSTLVIGRQERSAQIARAITTRTIALDPVQSVSSMTINQTANNTQVSYVISNNVAPHIEVTSYKNSVHAHGVITDGKATITISELSTSNNPYDYPSTVIIYGPKFDALSVKGGPLDVSSAVGKVDTVTLSIDESQSVTLHDIQIDNLTANLPKYASLSADQAAISHVTITSSLYTTTELGNIESLALTTPVTCGNSKAGVTTVDIQSISGDTTLNGNPLNPGNFTGPCYAITLAGTSE